MRKLVAATWLQSEIVSIRFSNRSIYRLFTSSRTWLLKAQLFTVQFRFEDAEKAYKAAIDAEPDSFNANFSCARFTQNLNRFEQAKTAYDRCLEWARKNGKDHETGPGRYQDC